MARGQRTANRPKPPKTPQAQPGPAKMGGPKGSASKTSPTNCGGHMSKHKLPPVTTKNKYCEVCYKLAPGRPSGHRLAASKWKQWFCVHTGVRECRVCEMRMCDKCAKGNWDHSSKSLTLHAAAHHRVNQTPADPKK